MAQRSPERRCGDGAGQTPEPVGEPRAPNRRALVLPGLLLGIGLGGFLDGIVLHQLLQWHHMLTSHGDYPATTVAGLEVNTLWDGLFHASTWVATALGLGFLWQAGRRRDVSWSGRVLVGMIAVGWGAFNLVEGLIDHHLLTIHHVRDDVSNKLPWDLGFLAVGALLVALGWWLFRTAEDEPPAPRRGGTERGTPASGE